MSQQIELRYGVLCDSLEDQVKEQGYTLGNKSETLEKIRQSINICGFHVATVSQVDKMFTKLHKKVLSALTKLD